MAKLKKASMLHEMMSPKPLRNILEESIQPWKVMEYEEEVWKLGTPVLGKAWAKGP